MGRAGGFVGWCQEALDFCSLFVLTCRSRWGIGFDTEQANGAIPRGMECSLAGRSWALGWFALEFFGRPIRRFFDLRGWPRSASAAGTAAPRTRASAAPRRTP